MKEQWREIPSFEGRYEVSNLGRVRSMARLVEYVDGRTRWMDQMVRVTCLDTNGYPSLGLARADGVTVTRAVHVLVAEAWLGPRPPGAEVCHNDGDKANPRLDNLRYDTRFENARDRVRHGTHHEASKTHCKHGHPFTPENTYHNQGRRHCRTCVKRRLRESKARRRAA